MEVWNADVQALKGKLPGPRAGEDMGKGRMPGISPNPMLTQAHGGGHLRPAFSSQPLKNEFSNHDEVDLFA